MKRHAVAALALGGSLLLGGCAVLSELLPELSTLPLPEDAAGDPQVFRLPGVIHRPTARDPVRRVPVDLAPGTYGVLELEMTVTHGGWSGRNPTGTHNIFWLARDRNRDLFGYVNIRNRNQMFLRHGLGQTQVNKARVTRRVAWPPGTTYRFHYLYDTRNRRIELRVNEGGRRVALFESVPNVRAIELRRGQRLLVDLGFTGRDNANEPASIGWRYRDLEVRVR